MEESWKSMRSLLLIGRSKRMWFQSNWEDNLRTDVIRAMEKTYILGNASVIDQQYVCTVPLELNNNLALLLTIATKYGFISAKVLLKEKKWSKDDF